MSIVNTPHKLLIVDDDLALQTFLREYLSKHNFDVAASTHGEDIVKLMQYQPFSLVILDVVLPGEDGHYWLEWLKHNYPEIKVLMLSVKGKAGDRILGLEAGATDYLAKPFNPRELLARINNILSPDRLPSQEINFGHYRFDLKKYSLSKDGELISLTSSEASILKYLCSNRFMTVTRDQLTQTLYGVEHSPLNRSVDVHIFNLRNKLEEDASNPEYIRTVWGKGYRFQP